jgi:hypothetical protein
MNASLAFIEGAKPRDEVECALLIQMACTHTAAMAVLSRLAGVMVLIELLRPRRLPPRDYCVPTQPKSKRCAGSEWRAPVCAC